MTTTTTMACPSSSSRTWSKVADLLRQRWAQPSLSIVDIRLADEHHHHHRKVRYGPTKFSVIPAKAIGKVSIRFVPKQDPDSLLHALKTHVDHEFHKLRSANDVRVIKHNEGRWWEADMSGDLMKCAETAIRDVWGVDPLHVREGGTMPVTSTMERLFQAPALLIPFGQASDSTHLPNERLCRDNLLRGRDVIRRLLEEIGQLARSTQASSS